MINCNISIKNTLNYLVKIKAISKRIGEKLYITNSKLGNIRLLFKLHKTKFSVRPIINSIQHPTSNICFLIDLLFQPYVKNTTSYIKDSQNLIQKTADIHFPEHSKIYSCDFESLYTNIDLDHAVFILMSFFRNVLNEKELNLVGLYYLIKLVFDNNYFKFKDKFYKQKVGIAMGTKCGPSIANLYIACLEEKFLKIHRPLSYYRFIDDIFLVTSESFNIDYLKNSFGYLKLNIVCENIVNFLDLNISICKITNRLVFSLYIKPTNTFSYLLTESNHPNFIFKNIPKGLFFRIRRICTNLFEYFYFSRKLIIQLLQRGYRFDTLNKTMIMVSKLERQDLLVYKEKNRRFENSQLLIVPFDNNSLNIFKII